MFLTWVQHNGSRARVVTLLYMFLILESDSHDTFGIQAE
jgi:hypothetical protein